MKASLITVRFKSAFPDHLIQDMAEGFLGLCAQTERDQDPRTLLLRPTVHEYAILKLQLQELESEGALSYSVERIG